MRKTEMYRLRPTKGETKNSLLYIAIDAVQHCRMEACPVFERCPYDKNFSELCWVEKNYLKAVVESITTLIREDTDQLVQNKITLHLLPLFQQLVRFQIEAVGVRSTIYMTPRGQISVHPIFKEIRETIKAIEATQRSMGIDGEYIRALENVRGSLRQVGQGQEKGMAEMDFRDRWNDETFQKDIGLRDPEDRPTLKRGTNDA